MVRLSALVKLLPSMDKACGTDDATIPAGVIEVIVGVVLAVTELVLELSPPQDASPNISTAWPANKPKLKREELNVSILFLLCVCMILTLSHS